MHYLGGKAWTGKRIAALIEQYRKPGQVFLEPFCGSLSVTQYVSGERIASDINKGLITLFKAMQNGFELPKTCNKEQYDLLRNKMDLDDPMTAVAGIVWSYGGAWFLHYVGHKYPEKCYRKTNPTGRKIALCHDVDFRHQSYDQYKPENMIIYCDPPYEGTNGYAIAPDFDHDLFWNTMRVWSQNNTVLISEFEAPSDFKCVWSIEKSMIFGNVKPKGKKRVRTEKIFTLNDPPTSLFEWPNK